jgi:hypothetical protein
MKKAGVMGQARKEPRFADLEVLAPVRSSGVAARLAVMDADISDADFETVHPLGPGPTVTKATQHSSSGSMNGLGLLRQSSSQGAAFLASGDQLSPGFLVMTLVLALAVFWLCGGHALLY